MPGIVLTTAVRTGPTTATTAATSTLFVVGVTEKGPEGSARLVTSLADYEAIYGNYVADGYVHQTIQTFFEEGGSRAYVSRVIPDDAVSASCSLAGSSGTALTLVASGEGAWANTSLKASVTHPSAGTNFRVRISVDGTLVYTTPTCTTVADAVMEINNNTTAQLYVTATAGGGTGIPVVVTNAAFSSGSDGGALDDGDWEEAIDYLISNLGPGAVCAPGQYTSTVYEKLISHAKANNRIALLGFDKDETVSDAIAATPAYASLSGSEHAAWFYPWVKIPRGALVVSVPCEGYVAAKRALVHNGIGAWTAYAGIRSQASFVVGVESAISASQNDTLNELNVNAIRIINGTVRIYGARSASSDDANYRFINSREVLNHIVHRAEVDLEALVFSVIDGRRALFGEVKSVLISILDPIAKAGGLYELYDNNGRLVDAGYRVTVSDELNPLTQLATGVVRAKVGARVSSIGDTIEVEITKSNLTASLG